MQYRRPDLRLLKLWIAQGLCMNRRSLLLACVPLLCVGALLGRGSSAPQQAAAPGGDSTVAFGPRPTFLVAAANLGATDRPSFRAGQALAEQPWVRAPSSTDARDGLGPLYNARRCTACHIQGGRGLAPDTDGPLSVATLVRLSVPGQASEPTYGPQLQPRSVDAAYTLGGSDVQLPGEGRPQVQWLRSQVRYGDGTSQSLRRPRVSFEDLGYGPLDANAQVGLRHAPPLYGMGLLDLIPEAEILAGVDPEDGDADGVSGRANWVADAHTGAMRLGRFGLKANQPDLRQQVAAALSNDMGLTNSLFAMHTCTELQPACQTAPSGAGADGVEVADALLDLIVGFNRYLAVPARRKPQHSLVVAGQVYFRKLGCEGCHRARWRTGQHPEHPQLSQQTIFPYTDLLLHDMGPELADGRPDGQATGREWRTPPLWGIGLARAVHADAGMLHDGRARNVLEAILWHGGEAQGSRDAFVALPGLARRQLVAFVRSL